MKKFLVVLLLFFTGIVAQAQTIPFQAEAFSHREYSYGRWQSWSRWERSDVYITIDISNDVVMIYSDLPQRYKIVDVSAPYIESDAECIDFRFYDQDADRGTMTLCQKSSGQSEIYIRFANVQWAYIVRRL